MTSTRASDAPVVSQNERIALSVVNDKANSFGLSINARNVVCNISQDGLAAKAGVRYGDTLLVFNGESVDGEAKLFEAMRAVADGQSVEFVATRAVKSATDPPSAL